MSDCQEARRLQSAMVKRATVSTAAAEGDGKAIKMDGARVPLEDDEEHSEVTTPRDISGLIEDLDRRMLDLGLQMRLPDNQADWLPIGLSTIELPRKLWESLKRIQVGILDQLINVISLHPTFLQTHMAPVANVDPYIARHLDIHRRTAGRRKRYLSVIRSDYFLAPDDSFKQIEVNTISVAGGGFSDRIDTLLKTSPGCEANFQTEKRTSGIGDAIERVFRSYKPAANQPPFHVVFIVKDYLEKFYNDQDFVCQDLAKRNIPVTRLTLADAASRYSLATNDETLQISLTGRNNNQSELISVAVLYLRGAYDPCEYSNEECWKLLEAAEMSSATVCPSVGQHLAGSKLVQSVLAEPGVIEELLPDNPFIYELRATFAEQFPLTRKTCPVLSSNLAKYILKPQREGGSNNLFGSQIRDFISSLEDEGDQPGQDTGMIVMEKLESKIWRDFPVRTHKGSVEVIGVIPEFGALSAYAIIPSAISASDKDEVSHEYLGLITKIKRETSNEAGVSSGHGFLTAVDITD